VATLRQEVLFLREEREVHQQRLALSDARIHVLEEGQKVTDLPRKIALPPPRGPCEKNHPLPLPPPPPNNQWQRPPTIRRATNCNQEPRDPHPPPKQNPAIKKVVFDLLDAIQSSSSTEEILKKVLAIIPNLLSNC
jgi:hypothetical protein